MVLLPIPLQRVSAYTSIGVFVQVHVRLFCDTISATYLAANPIFHKLSKHIKVDYHLVRKMFTYGHLHVRDIPTQSQVADIFTKGLSSQKFHEFKANLSVVSPRID